MQVGIYICIDTLSKSIFITYRNNSKSNPIRAEAVFVSYTLLCFLWLWNGSWAEEEDAIDTELILIFHISPPLCTVWPYYFVVPTSNKKSDSIIYNDEICGSVLAWCWGRVRNDRIEPKRPRLRWWWAMWKVFRKIPFPTSTSKYNVSWGLTGEMEFGRSNNLFPLLSFYTTNDCGEKKVRNGQTQTEGSAIL
jgi:hypothetical protein